MSLKKSTVSGSTRGNIPMKMSKAMMMKSATSKSGKKSGKKRSKRMNVVYGMGK